MESLRDLYRLAIGGLFLETASYREQREATDRVRRGFLLVALIGLLVGLAALIGQIGIALSSPGFDVIVHTMYDGLTRMPWYEQASEADPAFVVGFKSNFDEVVQNLRPLLSGSLLQSAVGVVLTPFAYVLGWLIFGSVAHLAARLFGGRGTFSQTLGCTALASSANLLNLVQIVPFAQAAGVTLLGLIASYVALREAHLFHEQPWRAFWTTIFGPLLLALLFGCAFCAVLYVVIGAAGA